MKIECKISVKIISVKLNLHDSSAPFGFCNDRAAPLVPDYVIITSCSKLSVRLDHIAWFNSMQCVVSVY